MNALRRRRDGRNSTQLDLNLVSLIDVFTILIFFLLANSTEVQTLAVQGGVRLPEARAAQRPREDIVVLVSGQELLVQGRKLADTPVLLADPGDSYAPLAAELERLAGRARVRADAAPAGVTIVGDREIPYRLLRKVMASAAEAGFTDLSFAVRRREGA